MGNFNQSIIKDTEKREIVNYSSLYNVSLSKVKEFFRNFEFSCENFAINLTEFEQIFGARIDEFQLWDTDRNGLIDAIEIFTGITIYSEGAVEDKFHFLFDLIDFNRRHQIGYYDLIFLFETYINAVFKMHKYGYQLPSEEIENFVSGYTLPQKYLNFSDLKRIICENNEILRFYRLFKITPLISDMKKIENPNKLKILSEDYHDFKYNLILDGNNDVGGTEFNPYYVNENKRFENYRKWIYGSLKKVTNYRNKNNKTLMDNLTTLDYRLKLKWVYGIKIKDEIKYPIRYLYCYSNKFSSNEIDKRIKNLFKQMLVVYSVGKLVIIFNEEMNTQSIYKNHENEVICFSISFNKGKFIASSEMCEKPSIHVWRSDNLETQTVIKGFHKKGIHLMSFSLDTKYLITCGMQQSSPILIFEWEKITIVFSLRLEYYAIDLVCMETNLQKSLYLEDENVNKKSKVEDKNLFHSFLVCSKSELILMNFKDTMFHTQEIPYEKYEESENCSEILCIYYMNNDSTFTKKDSLNFNNKDSKSLYIVCGHLNGCVSIWNTGGYLKPLIQYNSEIMNIASYCNGLIIATLSGTLYIKWDKNLTNEIYVVSVFEHLSVISRQLKCISLKYGKLLICSFGGDVIEIETNKFDENSRINKIIKVENNVRCMTIIKELPNLMIYGGDDRKLTIIDVNSNEIADIWQVEHTINCIDGICVNDGMFVLAVGCEDGFIRIRKNWEHVGKIYQFFGNKQILDIKFCNDPKEIIVCCEDKKVYFISFDSNSNDYKILPEKPPITFASSFPFSMNFNLEHSKLLVNTYQSKFNLSKTSLNLVDINSHDFSDSIDQVENIYWVNWETKYPINPKIVNIQSLSLSLASNHNFVIGSDEVNALHLWKDLKDVEDNISNIQRIHMSNIQITKLTLDDRNLYTAGFSDRMIAKYVIKDIKNDSNAVSLEYKEKMKNKEEVIITDVFLIAEIKYSQALKLDISTEKLEDNNVLVRGFLSKKLNSLFSKNFTEIEESTINLPPLACMNIGFIYGSHICEKRNSVRYLHIFKKNNQDPNQRKNSDLNTEMMKKMYNENDSSNMSINDFIKLYNFNKSNKDIHINCTRNIIYFNSRFIIQQNPLKNNQIVYEGHRHKVSCIAIHPYISGEVCINPNIFVWNPDTLETIRTLKTGHLDGILHLAFSKTGKYLVSVGNDVKFSIQVFLFEQSITLAFINSGEFPIYEMKFFNFSESLFITAGYRRIIIWKINGNCLDKKKVILSEELKYIEQYKEYDSKIFTCFDFLDYDIGSNIETDIIVGSNFGDICGISCNKYFVINSSAHNGTVNCIKVTDNIKEKKYLVLTSGEDGLIKIWDQTYNILSQIDVFSFRLISLEDFKRTYKGVQSLDIFLCEKGRIYLLIGLRSGDLVELEIKEKSVLFDNTLSPNSTNELIKSLVEKSIILPLHIYSYPYQINKGFLPIKTFFCLHPFFPIVAFFSGDQTIRLYDFIRNKVVLSSNLGYQATSACFSPDGKILAVGLINGYTALFDSYMKENKLGGFGNDYLLPKIDVLNYIKESNTPLEIKFSLNGELLAISYDNKRQNEKCLGGSYVALFLLKNSKLNNFHKKVSGIQNSDNVYNKLIDIFIPLSQYEQTNINKNESVCTSIDFSEDSLYVLLSSQKISESFIKEGNETIFIIWDILNNQIVIDQDLLLKIKFPSITLSNAIFAKNMSSILSQNSDHDQMKDLAIISTMWNIPTLDICIGGNFFGDINIFRNSSLYINYKQIYTHNIEEITLGNMTISRTFTGHSNEITKIQTSNGNKFIFTSGLNEQCIIQWNLLHEELFWDLDFFPLEISDDPFTDTLGKEEFDILCKESWVQRNNLIDIYNNKDENIDNNITIDLEYIIGRRAYDRRSNLKYDLNNRIVYSVSSYIVYLTNNDNQISQEFLVPEEDFTSNIQKEISCFAISEDKRYLAAGLNGTESQISIWELNTSSHLNNTKIPQCTIISFLKFNYNNKRLVGIGLNKFYQSLVFLVENKVESSEIIAISVLVKSLPFKIKDIEFEYESSDRFVTVGIQHLAVWNLKGTRLEYINVPFSNEISDKDISKQHRMNEVNLIQDENKFGVYIIEDKMKIDLIAESMNYDVNQYLKVSFLNIVCYKNNYVMGADDGKIYVFESLILSFTVKEHSGPITSIDKSYNYSLLLTGGADANVFMWRVDIDSKERIRKLIKIKSFPVNNNLSTLREILIDPFCNVQAVSIGMDKICVGTRSGDIYEFRTSDEDQKLINSEVNKEFLGRIQLHDHDPPISISIDSLSKRLFALSLKGTLIVWDIEKMMLVFSKEYKINSSHLIYHFKDENKALIAFDSTIIVIDTSKTEYSSLNYDIQVGKITDVRVSRDEKILAVASIANSNPQVDIFDIKMGFTPRLTLTELNASVKYLDFSLDSAFLLIEDNLDEIHILDVFNKNRYVSMDELNYEIEWCSDGMRYCVEKFKSLHNVYSDIHSISKIAKHPNMPFVAVGDQYGAIRIFNYPTQNDDERYMDCKTDHTGKIDNLIISSDQKYLISSSHFDRSIFIYRINNN